MFLNAVEFIKRSRPLTLSPSPSPLFFFFFHPSSGKPFRPQATFKLPCGRRHSKLYFCQNVMSSFIYIHFVREIYFIIRQKSFRPHGHVCVRKFTFLPNDFVICEACSDLQLATQLSCIQASTAFLIK